MNTRFFRLSRLALVSLILLTLCGGNPARYRTPSIAGFSLVWSSGQARQGCTGAGHTWTRWRAGHLCSGVLEESWIPLPLTLPKCALDELRHVRRAGPFVCHPLVHWRENGFVVLLPVPGSPQKPERALDTYLRAVAQRLARDLRVPAQSLARVPYRWRGAGRGATITLESSLHDPGVFSSPNLQPARHAPELGLAGYVVVRVHFEETLPRPLPNAPCRTEGCGCPRKIVCPV
jgi:hypothetical protein